MKSPISRLAASAAVVASTLTVASCTGVPAPAPERPAAAMSAPVTSPPASASAPSAPVTSPPASASASSAPVIGAAPSAERASIFMATKDLNLRQGAGVEHPILNVIPRGSDVTKTGKVSGAWWQVRSGENVGWMSTADSKVAKPKVLKAHADRWVIEIQPTYAGASFASERQQVVSGLSKVGLVQTWGKWSQVELGEDRGWILSNQLAASEAQAKERQPVHVRNADRLAANADKTVKQLEARYGQGISTVYGPRDGSVGHSSGLAADVMIKDYSSATGIKAGDEMADYVVKNHKALGLDYVIWRDRIWLVEDMKWGPYSKGGWGKHLEATRGWNPTTLHMDHLHIETFPE